MIACSYPWYSCESWSWDTKESFQTVDLSSMEIPDGWYPDQYRRDTVRCERWKRGGRETRMKCVRSDNCFCRVLSAMLREYNLQEKGSREEV